MTPDPKHERRHRRRRLSLIHILMRKVTLGDLAGALGRFIEPIDVCLRREIALILARGLLDVLGPGERDSVLRDLAGSPPPRYGLTTPVPVQGADQ